MTMLKLKAHTLLHAIRHENIEKLDYFIQKGIDLEKVPFPYPYDNFLEAIFYERKDKLLNFYLEKNYNLNPKRRSGEHLIMHWIAKHSQPFVIKLIDLGLDIHQKYSIFDDKYNTTLYYFFNSLEIPPKAMTPLAYCMIQNNIEIMDALLKSQAKLETDMFSHLLIQFKSNHIHLKTMKHFLIHDTHNDFMNFLEQQTPQLRKEKKVAIQTIESLENLILKVKLDKMNDIHEKENVKVAKKVKL